MYESRFGLRRRPFRPTPDTDSYYPATTHEAAIDSIHRALENDEGIVLLTGESGLGKTIVARRLLESFDEPVRCVLLTNSHFSRNGDLLQAILFDLGLPYQGLTEQVARLAVTGACLDHFTQGGKTIICVDEAHHLATDVLEELRLLSNLEGKAGKAVQVLLVGLPEIEEKLEHSALTALRRRLTTRAVLEPLDGEESADYLMHQVRVCGGQPDRVFGPDVLDILTHASGGSPRLLNQTAHLAFSLAAEAETEIVDAEAAVEAITRLGLDPVEDEESLATDDDPVRLIVPTAIEVPMAEPVTSPGRPTIPFPPVILPIDDGPPTYVYGDDGEDTATPIRASDRVG